MAEHRMVYTKPFCVDLKIAGNIALISEMLKMSPAVIPISKDRVRIIEVELDVPIGGQTIPVYSPTDHYLNIGRSPYFYHLTKMRDLLKEVTDEYFRYVVKAVSTDLYLMSQSVSSPMGQGSDSEPICVEIFDRSTHLVDSSQFGFEPILLNSFEHVYCFLPSFRGEDSDSRHLNQFYHAEYEGSLDMEGAQRVADSYIKSLALALLVNENLLRHLSRDFDKSIKTLERIVAPNLQSFPSVNFDRAADLLEAKGFSGYVETFENGRDITANGELKVAELLEFDTPFWITQFDRDRVPFYQKPDESNPSKAICADLIFPNLFPGAFGGEILGAGERQSDPDVMKESLLRQGVSIEPYNWYIDLRKVPNYSQTSGFGLGFERFIAAVLGLGDIRDAILYPRIKGECPTP